MRVGHRPLHLGEIHQASKGDDEEVSLPDDAFDFHLNHLKTEGTVSYPL
jgi:hypothetical protein